MVETAHGEDAVYERERLERDLNFTLRDTLSPDEQFGIVNAAEANLTQMVHELRRKGVRGRTVRLRGDLVAQAVDRALQSAAHSPASSLDRRRAYRQAHVLYRLARGGVDGYAEQFVDAQDVMRWLEGAYPRTVHLETTAPQYRRVDVTRWHPLRSDAAPEPQRVIRRSGSIRGGTDDLERVAFSYRRYARKVRRAFAGREAANTTAHWVTQWVLWSLSGQTVVRTSDLAALTTQTIRRVDPIAYLRWVIPIKDLDLDEIWSEANGLVVWPSPKLVFEPEAMADPRRDDDALPRGAQIVRN